MSITRKSSSTSTPKLVSPITVPKNHDQVENYKVTVAMTHDNNSNWYLFLHNDTESRSYRIKSDPGRHYIHIAEAVDSSLTDEEKFFERVLCGDLATHNLNSFQEIFWSTPAGQNQYFVCLFLARLAERDLVSSEVVTGLTARASYSDTEFLGEGEEGDEDGFDQVDIMHMRRWGENEMRDVEFRNDFVPAL